ncbi:zeta toxin family protein [Nocardiopsis sp. NPDC006938]|uniref:zeta toxin family protein n=1 Tax=Nocardiopsis sp. NPDC006938 TaxID=3364337 RepID=UPI0036A90B23
MSESDVSEEIAALEANKQQRIRALVPRNLPDRPPEKAPRFIIIVGQPGSGKSTIQERVANALGPSVASYDGDDNARIHPRFTEIMRDNGLQGQASVESRLPHGLDDELLGHLRGDEGGPTYDVVTSHPFWANEHADIWFDGFHERGYESTAVFVATHESNSLVGVAHRYQRRRDDPSRGYGRWVEAAAHDSSYAKGPRIAHELESTGKVAHIYVVNRDGGVLYENHRGPDGAMRDPLGAREAIVRERERVPTPEETERFDKIVSYMRSTDPEVRTEPLDGMVKKAVDYAETDQRNLRRSGRVAETTAPRRPIDAALREQMRGTPEGAETARTAEAAARSGLARNAPPRSSASRLRDLARSGRSSSGASGAAQGPVQRGSLPYGPLSRGTGSSPRGSTPGRGVDDGFER